MSRFWAEVVAQLAERSLQTQEIHGLIPDISKNFMNIVCQLYFRKDEKARLKTKLS